MTKGNGNLKSALLGALVTAVVSMIAWGAADRLSAESRIAKLEASAEANRRELQSMIQSMRRFEEKLDKLLMEGCCP